MNDKIHILFEDNHLLVVVKPPGILSQSDGSGTPDMLTLLKADIKRRHGKPGNVFLGLVHRLDRPVGGVMVFAKTSKCASRLSAQIRERTFSKEYLTVVQGTPDPLEGVLRDQLVKEGKTGTVRISHGNPAGKEAVLHYRTVSSHDGRSLVHVVLETGRPHQIRVQLAGIGTPVLFDSRYGADVGRTEGNIALFAFRLGFAHPTGKQPVVFEAPIPDAEPWDRFDAGDLKREKEI